MQRRQPLTPSSEDCNRQGQVVARNMVSEPDPRIHVSRVSSSLVPRLLETRDTCMRTREMVCIARVPVNENYVASNTCM